MAREGSGREFIGGSDAVPWLPEEGTSAAAIRAVVEAVGELMVDGEVGVDGGRPH
jgi:hypothetical protein